MSEVTRILSAIEDGEPSAADELRPLVYQELRKLAAAKLSCEKPGQTLQATVLVHEAWLRLVGPDVNIHWNGRGHFFGAAAKAMQRILVENARRKKRLKAGGEHQRVELSEVAATVKGPSVDVLAVAETGSFQEAADRRRLTQSAFSRRIQHIEEQIGVELFDRSRKPVQLLPTTADQRDQIAKLANDLRQLVSVGRHHCPALHR